MKEKGNDSQVGHCNVNNSDSFYINVELFFNALRNVRCEQRVGRQDQDL